ncbi:hypothetical protein ACFL3Q_15950, partial [Planctomycetota bacterium]
WRDFVVAESHYSRMLRTKQYKYCIYDSGSHREQLIDMENDPGEMKNLAEVENYKDVLDEHRRLLRGWVEKPATRLLPSMLFPDRKDSLPLK